MRRFISTDAVGVFLEKILSHSCMVNIRRRGSFRNLGDLLFEFRLTDVLFTLEFCGSFIYIIYGKSFLEYLNF